MKMHRAKECLQVHGSDLSGSSFDDVNLSGCDFSNCNLSGWRVHDVNLAGLKIDKANLAGASIVNGRMEGMTIDGVLVTELLATYRANKPAENSN